MPPLRHRQSCLDAHPPPVVHVADAPQHPVHAPPRCAAPTPDGPARRVAGPRLPGRPRGGGAALRPPPGPGAGAAGHCLSCGAGLGRRVQRRLPAARGRAPVPARCRAAFSGYLRFPSSQPGTHPARPRSPHSRHSLARERIAAHEPACPMSKDRRGRARPANLQRPPTVAVAPMQGLHWPVEPQIGAESRFRRRAREATMASAMQADRPRRLLRDARVRGFTASRVAGGGLVEGANENPGVHDMFDRLCHAAR